MMLFAFQILLLFHILQLSSPQPMFSLPPPPFRRKGKKPELNTGRRREKSGFKRQGLPILDGIAAMITNGLQQYKYKMLSINWGLNGKIFHGQRPL